VGTLSDVELTTEAGTGSTLCGREMSQLMVEADVGSSRSGAELSQSNSSGDEDREAVLCAVSHTAVAVLSSVITDAAAALAPLSNTPRHNVLRGSEAVLHSATAPLSCILAELLTSLSFRGHTLGDV